MQNDWPTMTKSRAYRQAICRAMTVYGYTKAEVRELFDVSAEYVNKKCEGYMRNRATAKKCGTMFESATAQYLAIKLGRPIERRARAGANDKGDIAGVTTYDGRPVVVECKCEQIPAISRYLSEAATEKENAGAVASFVVFKRPGIGMRTVQKMGRQYVVFGLADLKKMANISAVENESTTGQMIGRDGIRIDFNEFEYHGKYHIESYVGTIEMYNSAFPIFVTLQQSKNGDWFGITTLQNMVNILNWGRENNA